MKQIRILVALLTGALLGGSGCGGGGGGAADAASRDDAGGHEELGFLIRDPGSYQLACENTPEGFPPTETFSDTDWLCTYDYADIQGVIYVRSRPTSCEWMMSPQPSFTTDLAQISIGGAVSDLADATYDWGGNHHNDSLTVDYAGRQLVYAHSSYGLGFRACQPMDCVQIYDGATLIEDGCTEARTRPASCVLIQAGGTHDPLEDTFEPCPQE